MRGERRTPGKGNPGLLNRRQSRVGDIDPYPDALTAFEQKIPVLDRKSTRLNSSH